jgi:hypothetical protein
LESYGFVWKSSRKTHIGTPADWRMLQEVIRTGRFFDTKRELEFFATSDETARMLVEIFKRDSYARYPHILEPSAGEGAIVAAILAAISTASVTAAELDPMRARKLRARFARNERGAWSRG